MESGISSKLVFLPPLQREKTRVFAHSTGMQPFVSRDLMQFPVAIPGEGLIDVVVQSNVRGVRWRRFEEWMLMRRAWPRPGVLDLSNAGIGEY